MSAVVGVALGLVALLTAIPAAAQPPVKLARVGMLRTDAPGASGMTTENVAAFKQGLADEGFVEGRNLVIDVVTPRPNTDRLDDLARDLVRRNVDVIHAAGPQAARAASAATTTIPIVVHDYETDPVAAGFVTTFARPGRNITGVFLDLPELGGKWLELLRQAVPRMKRVGILWDPATGDGQRQAVETAARALGVLVQVIEVRQRGELEARFRQARGARVDAIVVLSSPVLAGPALGAIADLALRTRFPSISLFPQYAELGGLLAYGPRPSMLYREEGQMVAKILKGARPADLPIMRPARFELLVNVKAAKQLGVVMPAELLGRADRTIE